MLKILVVEDHAMVREGLLQALHGLEPDTQLAGAADAEEALQYLGDQADVDLVLLDLMLPGTSGMALLGVLRKRFPDIPIVVLSALDDQDTIARTLRQGAAGFISKSSSTGVMLDSLREVLAGGICLPPGMREPGSEGASSRRKETGWRYKLTQGQMRVLQLLVQGKTNRQIAELLGVTEGTVKLHVTAIFKAMNVANRSQALLLAKKQWVRL